MSSDFLRAAWPAIAAIVGAFAAWWLFRFLFMRTCWSCQTPVLPSEKRVFMLGFLPIIRCDRCGSWRGYILR
ncbi:MAG: hypothetical protein JWN34_6096 [Bryobacterales bacterium]|nr:hypothetical protein [Bryobacterales bacterium]